MTEIELKTPMSEKDVRALKTGDIVWLTGRIITARDRAHKYLVDNKPETLPFDPKGAVIYHCGPIARKIGDSWEIVSLGPTTSIRHEPFEAEVIASYGLKAVVGKGGMGQKTLAALRENGCVYLAAVGGAGASLAESVQRVDSVYMLDEFGAPEAVWILDVAHFGPLLVGMDSHGESIYRDVERESKSNLNRILSSIP